MMSRYTATASSRWVLGLMALTALLMVLSGCNSAEEAEPPAAPPPANAVGGAAPPAAPGAPKAND